MSSAGRGRVIAAALAAAMAVAAAAGCGSGSSSSDATRVPGRDRARARRQSASGPGKRQAAGDDRHQELHRGADPGRALRAGTARQGLRRDGQAQHRRLASGRWRDGRRPRRRLPGVHRHDPLGAREGLAAARQRARRRTRARPPTSGQGHRAARDGARRGQERARHDARVLGRATTSPRSAISRAPVLRDARGAARIPDALRRPGRDEARPTGSPTCNFRPVDIGTQYDALHKGAGGPDRGVHDRRRAEPGRLQAAARPAPDLRLPERHVRRAARRRCDARGRSSRARSTPSAKSCPPRRCA